MRSNAGQFAADKSWHPFAFAGFLLLLNLIFWAGLYQLGKWVAAWLQ